jgi:FtsP/CotA-like multicopper oxidase with cupredoxin domain
MVKRRTTRRQFLATAAALPIVGLAPNLAQAAPTILRATKGAAHLGPAGAPKTSIWGYDGAVPGPLIRIKQGQKLIRQFANELPQPSTIHWHGIRIKNAMDGVPGLTQPVTPPNGKFLYDFTAPDAGTYWYHPHNRTWEQLARGLYGALVIDEHKPPHLDTDLTMLIDDWRLATGAQIADGFGSMMDWSHGGRLGNWITVNGKADFVHKARLNERFRLRLINTANARIFSLGLAGLSGWIVALDGQPLAAPLPAEHLVLAPAQRADLIVDISEPVKSKAHLLFFEGNREYVLGTFDVSGTARNHRLPQPQPLPPNPLPDLGSLDKARRVNLHMEGGAMGAMRGAMMRGQMMPMGSLVENGKVWAFNGMAEQSEKPLITASVGETIRLKMKNDTVWPHAIHLHGHHFRQIAKGVEPGPLRDTHLIESRRSAEIAFVADNPGDWLLHCHMVEHAAGGMTTWIRVV